MIARQITFEEALKIAACGGTVGVSIPKTETPKEWGDYEHGSMGDRMTGSLFFEYHMPREGKEATATPVSAKEAVKLAAAGIPVGVSVAQKADPKEWTDFRASTMEQLFAGCLFFSLNEDEGMIGEEPEASAADAGPAADSNVGQDGSGFTASSGPKPMMEPVIPETAELPEIPESALKRDSQTDENAPVSELAGDSKGKSDGQTPEAAKNNMKQLEKSKVKKSGTAGGTEKKVDLGKVLALRKAGWTRKEIAEEMGIKIGSVDWYIKKALAKYGEQGKTAVKNQPADKEALKTDNTGKTKNAGSNEVVPSNAIPAVAGISAEN